MIRVKLYQNKNEKNETAYNKWYPRVIVEETIGLEELSAHMASHNTPFSKGAIKGILTDAVACTKELLLMGKNVKFPDLAIFSIGLKVKGGADTKADFSVAKYIIGLKLRARATGELSSANLDTSIKRVDAVKSSTQSPGDDSTPGGTPPSGGNTTPSGGDSTASGGGTTPSGGNTGTDSGTDSGTGDSEDVTI